MCAHESVQRSTLVGDLCMYVAKLTQRSRAVVGKEAHQKFRTMHALLNGTFGVVKRSVHVVRKSNLHVIVEQAHVIEIGEDCTSMAPNLCSDTHV